MEILLTCLYCDYKWVKYLYTNSSVNDKCSRCKDSNIKIKELNKTQIDTYQGAPEFPKKEEEKQQNTGDYFGF